MRSAVPVKRRGALFPLGAALAFYVSPAFSDSFPVRDQNPLLAGFGLPAALPVEMPRPNSWAFEAGFAWGNSAILQANTRETLIVDAETRELRIVVARGFGDGYAIRIEAPYRQTTGGSLDSFIDKWHDTFGLSEGARPHLPRNAVRIEYERDGQRRLDERTAHSGIGDISLLLGKRFAASPFAAWISATLPTGDANAFTGSGSVDISAALAFERSFGGRYGVHAQLAGTWLGKADRLRERQQDIVWSGALGVHARAFANLTLTAQLDAHSAVYDSSLEFLGEAVTLTVGGSYRLSERWKLSIGVTEDIRVDSTSDVVFVVQIIGR
jgi:hypothetical protein